MSEKELVTIVAASGKQANHLIPHLVTNARFRLRLVVNSARSRERMSALYPDAEVVMADLMQPNDCKAILKGATALYHVGPPMHPHETQLGYNVVDAAIAEAKERNFVHFVYSSVMNTQLRKLLNHDCKRYVEEYLIESGLKYTILNPTNTMESLPIAQWQKDKNPIWKCIHDPGSANSLLALRDLGEASARVLTEREKHFFAKYDCCSTMPMPYSDAIQSIGGVLGKQIEVQWLPYQEAVSARLAVGLGGDDASSGVRDIVQRLIVYSNDHAVTGNPNVLRWLLGRDTTSVEDWARLQLV